MTIRCNVFVPHHEGCINMMTAVYGRMNNMLCTAVPAVDTRISASRKRYICWSNETSPNSSHNILTSSFELTPFIRVCATVVSSLTNSYHSNPSESARLVSSSMFNMTLLLDRCTNTTFNARGVPLSSTILLSLSCDEVFNNEEAAEWNSSLSGGLTTYELWMKWLNFLYATAKFITSVVTKFYSNIYIWRSCTIKESSNSCLYRV